MAKDTKPLGRCKAWLSKLRKKDSRPSSPAPTPVRERGLLPLPEPGEPDTLEGYAVPSPPLPPKSSLMPTPAVVVKNSTTSRGYESISPLPTLGYAVPPWDSPGYPLGLGLGGAHPESGDIQASLGNGDGGHGGGEAGGGAAAGGAGAGAACSGAPGGG